MRRHRRGNVLQFIPHQIAKKIRPLASMSLKSQACKYESIWTQTIDLLASLDRDTLLVLQQALRTQLWTIYGRDDVTLKWQMKLGISKTTWADTEDALLGVLYANPMNPVRMTSIHHIESTERLAQLGVILAVHTISVPLRYLELQRVLTPMVQTLKEGLIIVNAEISELRKSRTPKENRQAWKLQLLKLLYRSDHLLIHQIEND